MKKKILAVVLGLTLCFGMTGCASWDRMVTDMKSDVNGGMQRTITITRQMVKNLQHTRERLILRQTMVDMLSLILTARDISTITAL